MEQGHPSIPQKARFAKTIHFVDWDRFLAASGLPAHRQESMGITIRWYLSWAKRARVAVDFDSARDFMAQVELEKRPTPHRLEQWKEALRWFFREGKRRREGGQNGQHSTPIDREQASNDAGSDAGGGPYVARSGSWREQMIRLIRVRKYAYRTAARGGCRAGMGGAFPFGLTPNPHH